MAELLSVPDAARALDLDPSRVRALAAQGHIPAVKIGERWALDSAAVAERSRRAPPSGRPLASHNAWALLFMASGHVPDWVSPQVRSRLRRALKLERLDGLAPRLGRRAEVHHLQAHPGEISRLLKDRDLVRSGISAARPVGVDLVSGPEADGYINEANLSAFSRRHALREVGQSERANVKLRVVPSSAWHLDERIAPDAAVALDLLEEPDARSRRAAKALLARLARDR